MMISCKYPPATVLLLYDGVVVVVIVAYPEFKREKHNFINMLNTPKVDSNLHILRYYYYTTHSHANSCS